MATRLERLFDLYAADLRRFAPNLDGHFGCPLCMQAVPRSSDLTDIVAEEHILSGKLGGRLVTLTCRKCNNTLGSELEAHLVRRVRVDFRKSPMSMRMDVGGTGVGAASDSTHPTLKAILYFSEKQYRRVVDVLDRLGLSESPHIVLIDARNDNKPSGSKA